MDGVQNSVSVPYRMFTWLKKSTAVEKEEKKEVRGRAASIHPVLDIEIPDKDLNVQQSLFSLPTFPSPGHIFVEFIYRTLYQTAGSKTLML